MQAIDVIAAKRDGEELPADALREFVLGYAREDVADYQMAAFLMAGYLNGFSRAEAVALTAAMLDSGDRLDLSALAGPTVDKHSTGGVGDGTTLVVAPLAAALGMQVVKLSGRGLGHTGGTLDKLDSIPGMRTELSGDELLAQVEAIGLAVCAQTADLVPADKAMYALRDVTATVDDVALIASSVMSKKLAGGAGAILLDVKTGSGAFMKEPERARELAELCVALGKEADRATGALITDMSQPLASAVGNASEVREAIEVLRGERSGRFAELCVALAGHMAALAGVAEDAAAGTERARAALASGDGLERFRRFVEAQGGDPRITDDPGLLPQAPVTPRRARGADRRPGRGRRRGDRAGGGERRRGPAAQGGRDRPRGRRRLPGRDRRRGGRRHGRGARAGQRRGRRRGGRAARARRPDLERRAGRAAGPDRTRGAISHQRAAGRCRHRTGAAAGRAAYLHDMSSSGMSARAWTLFAAVSVLWGIPYLFIKVAVDDLSPAMVAAGRIAVAFAVLLPLAWHKGALRGLGKHWKVLLVYSLVEITLPWPLIGFGEQRVSSGLAAILIAAVPLVVALIALRVDPDERAEGSRLAGLVVGFVGVDRAARARRRRAPGRAARRGGDPAGRRRLRDRADDHQASLRRARPARARDRVDGHLARRCSRPRPRSRRRTEMPSGDTLLSVLVLGLLCSAWAFLLFFALIATVGPGARDGHHLREPGRRRRARASPLLGERPGPSAVAGLLLILAGSWLSTGGRLPPGLMSRVARGRRARRRAAAQPELRAAAR